ncbi:MULTISPECIES: DUF3443 domain-containing protein [Burkholderia]|uniref:DUF3443 domain-containing protein n=1 Tax=Burkholderia savannae TaxID=1637837 RepID=A0ABR5T9H6_9BURK|nr:MULTISPECIES: DUF3443 domain-containing protein [Burkholderia]AOJ70640.1 hypothetical protein WS78_19055 [Burkholderia savannae]AOK45624.1 hypothetical protein WT60_01225 [Burkholderia sp. MSMB617WGS]KGS03587.1 hypothetical protein X946_2985 [Burkholderia sp. ABCPW 111]KVG47560.1 hypothetical protein WS77_05350 [Burkholderia sp. MSMB0265]KVG82515.1 hypothetical protein WS81_01915 [Burkholderia sp. MSMB2040]
MRFQHTLTRWLGALSLAAATVALVAACGGGGDGGSNASVNTGSGGGNTSAGGGSNGGSGGSGGSGSSGSTPLASNQAAITVSTGVATVVNMPTVDVTICAPGTSTCQTINNVLVDTASYGLRIVNTAASNVLGSLPISTVSSGALVECGKFVTSYTWGTVRTADVKIAGEQASSLPVQVIGDLGSSGVPTSCSNGNSSSNTAADLGANGILGIGPAPYDCGTNCATSTLYSNYYACPNGNTSCQVTTVPLAQQVANPVPRFATDNNGVIVAMNPPSGGNATGTLTFGINTQANNALPSSATVLTSTTAGDLTGTLLGRAVSTVFFDTGSNAYFFDTGGSTAVRLPVCSNNSSFYCPTTGTQTTTPTVVGLNGAQASPSISIDNANSLFSTYRSAVPNLGGPFGDTRVLDFGLPHFFGKTLYFGMDLRGSGGPAPYVAF